MKQKCDNPYCKKYLDYTNKERLETANANGWVTSGLPGHLLCPECSIKLKRKLAAEELQRITEKLQELTNDVAELQKRGECE